MWIKYGGGEDWCKFEIEKHPTAVRSLPCKQKHSSLLPVKQSKAVDLQKLVKKYVPQEYHSFYELIGDEDVSLETDESDEN